MTLVWQDEFKGNSLSSDPEIGNDPKISRQRGNNELQYYKPENTTVSDGFLKITTSGFKAVFKDQNTGYSIF